MFFSRAITFPGFFAPEQKYSQDISATSGDCLNCARSAEMCSAVTILPADEEKNDMAGFPPGNISTGGGISERKKNFNLASCSGTLKIALPFIHLSLMPLVIISVRDRCYFFFSYLHSKVEIGVF
jgi:hypothetical protein